MLGVSDMLVLSQWILSNMISVYSVIKCIIRGMYADLGRTSTNPAILNRLLSKYVFLTHQKVYDYMKLECCYLQAVLFSTHIKEQK